MGCSACGAGRQDSALDVAHANKRHILCASGTAMKAHIGVDAETGVVHTLVTTSANVSDVTQAHALLHGEERFGVGDAGYQGAEKREENQGRQIQWEIAMRPGKRKALPDTPIGRLQERIEQVKASIRAKVEHPFRIIKNLFGMKKVSWRRTQRGCTRSLGWRIY